MSKRRTFVVILTVEGTTLDDLDEVPLDSETLSNTLTFSLRGIEAGGDCKMTKVIIPGVTDG